MDLPSTVKGTVCELACQAYLLREGYTVLVPTTAARYDLVAGRGGAFIRVQCKYPSYEWRSREGVMYYRFRLQNFSRGQTVGYHYATSDFDYLWAQTPHKAYFVPVAAMNHRDNVLPAYVVASRKWDGWEVQHAENGTSLRLDCA